MTENNNNKTKLDWLMDSFDKKFMEEFFNEFAKVNRLPSDQEQFIQYEYNGFLYHLRRIDVRVLNEGIARLKREQVLRQYGKGQQQNMPQGYATMSKAQLKEYLRKKEREVR